MNALQVVLVEPSWPELAEKMARGEVIHLANGAYLGVAGLDGGMQSGSPSVALRVDLPDGRVVVAETSLALFLTAAEMLRARYGDPRR